MTCDDFTDEQPTRPDLSPDLVTKPARVAELEHALRGARVMIAELERQIGGAHVA